MREERGQERIDTTRRGRTKQPLTDLSVNELGAFPLPVFTLRSRPLLAGNSPRVAPERLLFRLGTRDAVEKALVKQKRDPRFYCGF